MNKVLNTTRFIISLLGTFCIIITACTQPIKTEKPKRESSLKTIDKATLLTIIEILPKNLSEHDFSVSYIVKVLEPYSSKYRINIPGKAFNNSTDYLSVYLAKSERDTTKIHLCSLTFPKKLYKQLTFNDLKSKFGDWQKEPINSRPLAFKYITTSFKYKAAPRVNITVNSKKLPESLDNSIEEILFLQDIM